MSNSNEEDNSAPSMENDHEKFRSHFWTKLQNELGIYIPCHMKNILRFSNLDNPISFRGISEDIILELEEFAQTSMFTLIEDKNEDLKKYYGIYHKNPEKFKFVIGDKLLLQQLVEFVKNKPIHYWGDIRSSSQHNTITSIQHALNHPFEIDTEAQKKKLQRQIATMVKKNSAKFSLEFGESERLSVEKNVVIDVTAKQNKENTNVTYEAKITCPICSKVTTFTKIAGKEYSKTRWIISNFTRHVMTHSANISNRNKPKQRSPHRAEAVERSSQSEQEMMLNSNSTDKRIEDLSVVDIENIPPNPVLKKLLTNSTIEPTTVVGKALGVLTSIENCTGE